MLCARAPEFPSIGACAPLPSAAAKKAARILFRKAKKGVKSVKFILRETTRNSDKKSYFYEGFVHEFDSPKVIQRNGIDITIHREIKVKTCKESQMGTVARTSTAPSS